VQIEDAGPRAPVFEVVSRPNDWQKTVKQAGGVGPAGPPAGISPLNAQRQDFFADILAEVIARQPAIRMPARNNGNWLSFASGPFGSWSMSVTAQGQLRVEAYLDSGDKERNKQPFDETLGEAAKCEQAVGTRLSWERLDERRAARIAAYHTVDLGDDASRNEAKAWAVTTLENLFTSMNRELRSRAKAIRQTALAAQDATETAAYDAGEPAGAGIDTEPPGPADGE